MSCLRWARVCHHAIAPGWSAILGAVGRAARQGAIIKGGLYLEQLLRVDTVLLGKARTLTLGISSFRRVSPAPGRSVSEVLQLAASVEHLSENLLAAAIVAGGEGNPKGLVEAASLAFSDRSNFLTIRVGVHAPVDKHTTGRTD